MSNALSQSATNLAISSTSPEQFDFLLSVKRQAERKLPANGLTVVALTMGRSKLIASVCGDFKSHYPSLFDKRDDKGNKIPSERLDEPTYNKVVEAVDKFLAEQFAKFTGNPDEVVKTTSRFAHLTAKKDIVLRHTIVRDEIISLKQRKFAAGLFIGETMRQIAKIDSQKTVLSEVTMDRLTKLNKRLAKEQETLAAIELQIAQQTPVAPAS